MNRSPENKLFKVTLRQERTYTVRAMQFGDAEKKAVLAAMHDDVETAWKASGIMEVSV